MADGESGAKALNASRINSTGGLDLAPEIAAALSECVSSTELSWPALGYESKNALKLLATGSAYGYAALKPHLADDAVVYSAFKLACAGSQTKGIDRWYSGCGLGELKVPCHRDQAHEGTGRASDAVTVSGEQGPTRGWLYDRRINIPFLMTDH